MAAEAVSVEEHLLSFVNQIAANQKFETFDIKITPVTSGGSNYTSILFKIKIIHDDRNELDLFAKVGALNENFRKQALFIFNPYDNERLFYNCLMKTYRQLEKNRRVSEKDSIKFPAYYGAKESYGREIMVLEDLASRGYGSANRFKSVDWSYAAAAITELAKFHALSLAFKHETPSEFDKFTAQFRRGLFEKCKSADIMFEGAISLALATVHKENKEKLENFLKSQDSVTYFNDLFKPLKCNVILHADFRTSNMMHKVFKDGITEVIPIDYQTIQAGSPVIDLFYFIFSATDGSFRANYYNKLINHYYTELGVALARLDLNIEHEFARKDFDFELKEKLPFGLLTAVMVLPPQLTPGDQIPAVGEDFSTVIMQTSGEQYSQRLNEVVDEYVTFGVLREKNT